MTDIKQVNKRAHYDICFSVLNYNSEDRTIFLLEHIVELAAAECARAELTYSFIVRDNSPTLSQRLADVIKGMSARGLVVFCETSPNAGFGRGHNLNYKLAISNVFIAMNNDMTFPHLGWLVETYQRLLSDVRIGAIGLEQENFKLNPEFAYAGRTLLADARLYLDGSLLCLNSNVYASMGGFDESFGLAYFEDTDLSLRLRAAGYRLETANIPHEHFRSSSTAKLPPSFYSSVYEKGRSVFFGRWARFLETGVCNNLILVNCDHDGLGDFFLSLYPLRAFVKHSVAVGFYITIYVRHSELALFLSDLDGIEIVTMPVRELGRYGRVIRLSAINMALPLSSIDLYAAQLGLTIFSTCSTPLQALVEERMRGEESQILSIAKRDYVVCHFDNTRKGFAGRVLGRDAANECLSSLVAAGQKLILVGARDEPDLEDPTYEKFIANSQSVTDLRDKTSMVELIYLIAHASRFVGIDSGPANIAQVFEVPSLLIFGSTLPETKVYRSNVSIFVNAALPCLGCYHTNVEYAYATCYRNDEACVKSIDCELLSIAIARFIASATPMVLQSEQYRVRVREHLMQMMYNPLHKSRSYSQSGFLGKSFADSIIDIVDMIGRRAIWEGSGIKDIAFRLERENLELKDKIKEYGDVLNFISSRHSDHTGAKNLEATSASYMLENGQSSANQDVSNEQRNRTSMALLLPPKAGVEGCSLQVVGDRIVVESNSVDPRIALRPVLLTGECLLIEIDAFAEDPTKFKIYWSVSDPAFSEAQAADFLIGPTPTKFSREIRANKGDILYIRLDPAELRSKITFSFNLSGKFRLVKPKMFSWSPAAWKS